MPPDDEPYPISRHYWELEFELDPLAPAPDPPERPKAKKPRKRKAAQPRARPPRPALARQEVLASPPAPRLCFDFVAVELWLARSRLEAWTARFWM